MMKVLIIILVVILAILFLYFFASFKCFEVVFKTSRNFDDKRKHKDKKSKIAVAEEYLSNHEIVDLKTISDDKHELSAHLLKKGDTNLYLIMCHGWRGNWKENTPIAEEIDKKINCNFLFIEQRAHSTSMIKYSTMGWHERIDVLKWIDLIIKQDPRAQIVLYGDSMGATTLMNVSGEKLPSNVRCIIADCGFNSIKQQVLYSFKFINKFFIFFYFGISLLAKIILHISLKNDGPNKSLSNCGVPILFIHGTEDKFVPYSNLKANISCLNPSMDYDELAIEKAGHIASFYTEKEKYIDKCITFIEKNLKNAEK